MIENSLFASSSGQIPRAAHLIQSNYFAATVALVIYRHQKQIASHIARCYVSVCPTSTTIKSFQQPKLAAFGVATNGHGHCGQTKRRLPVTSNKDTTFPTCSTIQSTIVSLTRPEFDWCASIVREAHFFYLHRRNLLYLCCLSVVWQLEQPVFFYITMMIESQTNELIIVVLLGLKKSFWSAKSHNWRHFERPKRRRIDMRRSPRDQTKAAGWTRTCSSRRLQLWHHICIAAYSCDNWNIENNWPYSKNKNGNQENSSWFD